MTAPTDGAMQHARLGKAIEYIARQYGVLDLSDSELRGLDSVALTAVLFGVHRELVVRKVREYRAEHRLP